ncbi:hypothetical protein Acor_83460 [Acrocarpospora corrugata]|uniref:Uncharacterized protein n=1 Tax=Acrocarpospora corrugata TaxID=35763 RepID=A0A5M3WB57_9ACTN|nr:hypothetical protein Acor_83460 [Acrocarpospora corrugata]
MQGLTGESRELNGYFWLPERLLDVGPKADGAGNPLSHEDAAPLPSDHQPLIAQLADGLLNGHAGDAESLGQLWAGRKLLSWNELPGQDGRPELVGHL